MKKLLVISSRLLFLLLIGLLFSCQDFNPEYNRCDKTAKPEKDVSLIVTVHVLAKDNQPIAEQDLTITMDKKPCGEDLKGMMYFFGPTNEEGTRQTTVAYYSLRNLHDQIIVQAEAIDLGNGSVEDNSEEVVYEYDDFLSGSTKEVHLYIHRKF